MSHSMNPSVSGMHGFGLFFDRTRRSENVFISLRKWLANMDQMSRWSNWPTPEGYCGRACSRDLLGHSCSHDTKRSATGLRTQPTRHCTDLLLSYNISVSILCYKGETDSELAQSKPAGHKSAPVHSWWNPLSILTFRANGGLRFWPWGVIQSRTTPFKLFVSSDLALEAPFCIFSQLILEVTVTESTYKFCNVTNIFVRAVPHQAIFDSGYHLKQRLEYVMLPMLPLKDQQNVIHTYKKDGKYIKGWTRA